MKNLVGHTKLSTGVTFITEEPDYNPEENSLVERFDFQKNEFGSLKFSEFRSSLNPLSQQTVECIVREMLIRK